MGEGGRTSIRHDCQTFELSQRCYRHQPKASEENVRIADWLVHLTTTFKDWDFGLCFLYLRNVKGFGWNHKRLYRIYRELELNLRIKPKKRIVREKPEPLVVLETINQVWSMDFSMTSSVTAAAFGCSTCWITSTVRDWPSKSTCRCHQCMSSRPWSRSSSGAASRA